jgi:hypothetical protein
MELPHSAYGLPHSKAAESAAAAGAMHAISTNTTAIIKVSVFMMLRFTIGRETMGTHKLKYATAPGTARPLPRELGLTALSSLLTRSDAMCEVEINHESKQRFWFRTLVEFQNRVVSVMCVACTRQKVSRGSM